MKIEKNRADCLAVRPILCNFASELHVPPKDMNKDNVLSEIRNVANNSIPKGAKVILYGSQARGDAKTGSDWDLLILLDKKSLKPDDHDLYSYPFWELGWKIDAMIHPAVYTNEEWEVKVSPAFKENVEHDGIVLC